MQTTTVLNEKCFQEFVKLIHKLTGITIASNRLSMIEGRLRKRVSAHSLASFEEYLTFVLSDRKEQATFIDVVTTNETYFFRTPRIWDFVENRFLMEWHKNHPKKVFTAWSAASSSGEEAHSLALLCHAFKEKNPGFVYQITGTDISNEMVALCQEGKYSGRSIESFKKTRPEMFAKYLKPSANDIFQVLPEIKSRLKFQQHNLFNVLRSNEKFDLVLIRNVLIYFSQPDQEKVLTQVIPRIASDGLMIIGESESLSHIKTSFKQVEPLVYRLDTSTPASGKVA